MHYFHIVDESYHISLKIEEKLNRKHNIKAKEEVLEAKLR